MHAQVAPAPVAGPTGAMLATERGVDRSRDAAGHPCGSASRCGSVGRRDRRRSHRLPRRPDRPGRRRPIRAVERPVARGRSTCAGPTGRTVDADRQASLRVGPGRSRVALRGRELGLAERRAPSGARPRRSPLARELHRPRTQLPPSAATSAITADHQRRRRARREQLPHRIHSLSSSLAFPQRAPRQARKLRPAILR